MCFFGFLSGVSVGKMILYSQKKSQIQFPVFETKYHPRYHSNWHKAPLLRIQSYTPQGNGCGLRQFLLSLNRISKLPSKVHSANPSIPQSHLLRLSVNPDICLLLFLNGFSYDNTLIQESGFVNQNFSARDVPEPVAHLYLYEKYTSSSSGASAGTTDTG